MFINVSVFTDIHVNTCKQKPLSAPTAICQPSRGHYGELVHEYLVFTGMACACMGGWVAAICIKWTPKDAESGDCVVVCISNECEW